jgi:hypothetical protein
VFHLSWFLLLASALLWTTRGLWKRGLCAAAIPALLILGVYVKNFAMFGELIPGQVYKQINYVDMVQGQAPPEEIRRLQREGKISPILERPVLETFTDHYADLVKRPEPTGVLLLDVSRKSTGADNWNSIWRAKVSEACYRDAQVVARECPGLHVLQLRENLVNYLLPASEVFPFDGVANSVRLRPLLTWYERITGGEGHADDDTDEPPIAWMNVFLLPVCLVGGLVFAIRALPKRGRRFGRSIAQCATIVFLLFNIVYDSAVTILFSTGDHNRYREEVAPLYIVLLGLIASAAWVWLRRRSASLSTTLHPVQY